MKDQENLIRERLAEQGIKADQIARVLNPREGRLRTPTRVTIKAAEQLLLGVYSMIPDARKIDLIDQWYAGQGQAALQFRDLCRKQLEESGLAQTLPAGFDLLPDFYSAVPAWAKPWYVLVRPRNHYQLGRHIARHLSWYLNPKSKVTVPPELFMVGVPIVFFGLAVFGPQLLKGVIDLVFWPVVLLAACLTLFKLVRRTSSVDMRQRLNIERLELYRYLADQYEEAVDPSRIG